MIENNEQLAATLDYIAKWADALEGLRQVEAAENKTSFFPVSANAPLTEIRKNLELARDYVNREATKKQSLENGVYRNGHAATATPKELVTA